MARRALGAGRLGLGRTGRLELDVHRHPRGGRRRGSGPRARRERIGQALARLPELAEIKAQQGQSRTQARASTTAAAATVMKMGEGGCRPAYKGQYATDTASQAIVGVAAVTVGTDMAQPLPRITPVEERYGHRPDDAHPRLGAPATGRRGRCAQRNRSNRIRH